MSPFPTSRTRYSASVLLAAAGFAVVAGVMCGIEGWGENRIAGLAFLTLGFALGIAGVARTGGEGTFGSNSGGRARVIAGLMLLHVLAAVYYCSAAARVGGLKASKVGRKRMSRFITPIQTESLPVLALAAALQSTMT